MAAEERGVIVRKAEPGEAAEIRKLLEREGIPVRLSQETTGRRAPWFAWWARSRPVEVSVPQRDADRAKKIVDEFKTFSRRER